MIRSVSPACVIRDEAASGSIRQRQAATSVVKHAKTHSPRAEQHDKSTVFAKMPHKVSYA
jgi:hypothetical protein